MFFLQMLHEEVTITGANFFKINIGLIGDVSKVMWVIVCRIGVFQYFGKGIQYLLILYQSYN
jgi:hypothetical protein